MTEHDEDDVTADSGVKVVGAPPPSPAVGDPPAPSGEPTERSERARRATLGAGTGRSGPNGVLAALAAVATVLALTFGVLYATAGSTSGTRQDPDVKAAATKFLTYFFNFNAKSVDSDFNTITAMATGTFATQTDQFFNSAIRKQLETALAESRGQIQALYVQNENDAQTTAKVYAVVDQLYINNKITTPQADTVRLVMELQKVGSTWKISGVSVLQGATPASVGTPSGAAGSSVPGQ